MRSSLLLSASLAVFGCSGDSGLTSRPVGGAPGGAADGAGEAGGGPGSVVEPGGEGEAGDPVGVGEEREGPSGTACPEGRDPLDCPADGEGEGEGEGIDGPDPPGQRACVQREREDVEVCGDPCGAGCADGTVCLTFPAGRICLSAGERADAATCTAPGDCDGGLCVWSGGGPAHCTRECPSMGGGGDAVCGEGRSCLPSTTPAGSFHCYATGDLPTGEPCLRREGECEGGYCLGAGQAAYCTAWCDPAAPDEACPAGWKCRSYGDAHICCDPNRTQGGC